VGAKFLHVGMKEQWDKSVGRIVPHNITGGGAVMLQCMRASVLYLMFFWPCIMDWLYIKYQLDALIIIYS